MNRPDLMLVRDLLANLPDVANTTIAELRVIYDRLGLSIPPGEGVIHEAIIANGVAAEWSSVPDSDPSAVMLYLHGGGYTVGSLTSHRTLVSDIVRSFGGRGLALAYRLAPEHPFPAALDDAMAGYRFLLSEGVDPKRIVVAGDSAGGGLALATLVTIRDQGLPLPVAAWGLSPWVDLEMTSPSITDRTSLDPLCSRAGLGSMAAKYLAHTHPGSPLVSPLNADLRGLPPLLIQVGSSEILLDECVRFAHRAGAAEVAVTLEVWPEMIHVWQFFAPILPDGRAAIAAGGRFLRSHL